MSTAELLAKCRGMRDPELPWWRPVMGSKTRDQLMLFLAEKEMSMRSPRGTDMFFPKLWSVDLTGCTYETAEQSRPGFCDRCKENVTSNSTWQMKHFVKWLFVAQNVCWTWLDQEGNLRECCGGPTSLLLASSGLDRPVYA